MKKPTYQELEKRVKELEQVEDELRESEQKFRSLAENSRDNITRHDREGRYLYANPASLNFVGVTEDNIIGKTRREVGFPPELCDFLDDRTYKVLTSGKPGQEQFEWESKDGKAMLDWRLYPEFDEDGKIRSVLGISRDITEMKKAEEELYNSYELLNAVVEGTTDLIFIKDLEGRYIMINRSGVEFFGKPKEKIIGKDDTVHFSPEAARLLMEADREIMDSGKGRTLEEVFQYKGKTLTWLVTKVPQIDQEGNVTGIIGMARDITERKKMEETMRKNEEKYRIITENHIDLIDTLNMEGIIQFVSPSYCRALGKTEEELLGTRSMDLVHEDDIKETEEAMEDLYKPPYKCYVEQRVKTKDGWRWYGWEAKTVLDENDNPTGFVSVGRDVTERRQVQDALKKSEEKYRWIIENQTDLIGKFDRDGYIQFASPSYCRYFGKTEEELLGKQSMLLVREEDREKTAKAVENLFKPPYKSYVEQRVMTKEGWRWCGWAAKAVLDSSNNVVSLISVGRDITDQKQLEEQLQIRQRMDSLGTLAGGIAHDFNNLLVGIMGYIDLLDLDAGSLSEKQKHYIDNALKSSQRAADLVKQLQTLSVGVVSSKASVDIYEIAGEVFGMLERTTDRLIKKEVGMKPGEFYVTANSTELNQVFLNLGTNAVQSIKGRGVNPGDYIRVTAEDYIVRGVDFTGLPEGDYVHVTFEDNGGGMSDEVKRRAFDPLFTTKDKGGKRGQGLGLAMVFNIVTRRHVGHIYIDGEEGKGTEFHIYLPKGQAENEAKVTESVGGGSETVLIIEDEEQVGKLAVSLLERYGYNVLTEADGEHGLDQYTKNKKAIDLVLLDLTMPRMSGKMVFEKILEINPDVKVIICSGQSDEDIREGILSHAQDFLKKPYRVKDLAKTVRKVLDS